MNSINLIHPYRFKGQWVFDDPSKKLTHEPFVAGIDSIIDYRVNEIPNAENGFNLFFSSSPFPDSNITLSWVSAYEGGNWYIDESTGMMGWLCPALLKYFNVAPTKLYIRVTRTNH